MSINIDKLSIEVLRNLDIYLANTIEDVERAVYETADETVAELKKTSPVGPTGDYAKSWTHKRDNRIRGKYYLSRVVCQKKPNYRLTHLLEFGHAKVNGGRVNAQPHIQKAEENALIRLNTKLLRKLRYQK